MRKRMITRAMKVTQATTLMVNIETQATETLTISMPSTYKDDNALMKAITKAYEGGSLKPVHVMASTVIEKLYGMSEKDFLDNAVELDPKTRKVLGSPADEEPVEEA